IGKRCVVDDTPLKPRRGGGREGGGEAQRAYIVKIGRRPAERLEQTGAVAALVTVKTAEHGLVGIDGHPTAAQRGDQGGGGIGLAEIGAGGGDEEARHQVARRRTDAARRSVSSSACPAVKTRRSRAAPAAIVGGRMATTRNPSASSDCCAASA